MNKERIVKEIVRWEIITLLKNKRSVNVHCGNQYGSGTEELENFLETVMLALSEKSKGNMFKANILMVGKEMDVTLFLRDKLWFDVHRIAFDSSKKKEKKHQATIKKSKK